MASRLNLSSRRFLLTRLVATATNHPAAPFPEPIPAADLQWLVRNDLGPLLYRYLERFAPDETPLLLGEQYNAIAQYELHARNMESMTTALAEAGIGHVVLKGAALAHTVYHEPALRQMSDVDIWIQAGHMLEAVRIAQSLGFAVLEQEDRPLELQEMAAGEIALCRHGTAFGLLELHWSPFPGWWFSRLIQADLEALWSRTEPLGGGWLAARHLSPEDTVLHISLHMAINHACQDGLLRAMLDIAATAQSRPVDWQVVAQRADEWQVSTATWLLLSLVNDFFEGVEGLEYALDYLRPGTLRRRLIGRFVGTDLVINGEPTLAGTRRYFFLMCLIDEWRDMMRMLFLTLWPEQEWLEARYPNRKKVRLWHLWRVLRYGQI